MENSPSAVAYIKTEEPEREKESEEIARKLINARMHEEACRTLSLSPSREYLQSHLIKLSPRRSWWGVQILTRCVAPRPYIVRRQACIRDYCATIAEAGKKSRTAAGVLYVQAEVVVVLENRELTSAFFFKLSLRERLECSLQRDSTEIFRIFLLLTAHGDWKSGETRAARLIGRRVRFV